MEWLRSKLECDLGKKQILAITSKRGRLADSLVQVQHWILMNDVSQIIAFHSTDLILIAGLRHSFHDLS